MTAAAGALCVLFALVGLVLLGAANPLLTAAVAALFLFSYTLGDHRR